jgi:hypothetical protein
MQHGGSFTPGEAQYAMSTATVNSICCYRPTTTTSISGSRSASFGSATVVADVAAYGPFHPGTRQA